MIKIGITGSSGILGKSLIKNLKKYSNYKIHKYRHNILDTQKINEWIKKNNFEIILHLAAKVPTSKAKSNYELVKKVNFNGTKNLINAINTHQNKKVFLFFSSTSHVYNFNKKIIKENFKKRGISKYGKTKILAENFLLKNKKKLNLCIGRISSLTSENQSQNFVIKKIAVNIKKKKFVNFGNSNIKRDFIYVDDVAKIISKIIKKKITGVINISTSEVTNIFDLLNYMNKFYKSNIDHFKGKEESLVLSNKFLIKKIGKYNFMNINQILKKFF